MRRVLSTRGFLLALALASCALLLPAGALASKASILRAIVKASPKIAVVEGHVLSAEGEYSSTKEPAPVEAAIDKSVLVLRALEHKVAAQSAARPMVKRARSKIVRGLAAIVAGYGDLKSAFADKVTDPTTSKAEATTALSAVKTGKKQLESGVLLLK